MPLRISPTDHISLQKERGIRGTCWEFDGACGRVDLARAYLEFRRDDDPPQFCRLVAGVAVVHAYHPCELPLISRRGGVCLAVDNGYRVDSVVEISL